MNKSIILMIIYVLSLTKMIFAQKEKSDGHIVGHVICVDSGEHLAFANLQIKGTAIGTTTDETGHYRLINIPVGSYVIEASFLGYKPKQKEVIIKKGQTKELHFKLESDALGLKEVVVTGNRNEISRKESPVIVNTLTTKQFSSSQSVTLCEGLNFSPGLRMENNCQNCGFTQVRMNGMEGPYSQILINSRPIFSGLAGVYGLELIPANMIDRVEIIRGGGSALYGSNAIAGTINIILKEPDKNTYELGINSGLIGVGLAGDPSQDYSVNFNTTLISTDSKTGMALYGFYRDRQPFDANNDDFSEISLLKNNTIGTRIYHRFSSKSKITADFFNIHEERRGGDRFDYPSHEANIAEAVTHNITTGALSFDQYFRELDKLSVYTSAQRVARDSYYGANQSLSDYGDTKDLTYTIGAQYNYKLNNSEIIAGIENVGGWLKDVKPGYADINNATIVNDSITNIPHTQTTTIADQTTNTTGIFAQYDITINLLKISFGFRYDNYKITNNAGNFDETRVNSENSGDVISPRLTFKYDLTEFLQTRLSYSQGYRAPQIFDEDLHIESSGSRKVLHRNSDDLKQETSNSVMASLDFNRKIGNVFIGFLAEGFYTKLDNPFSNVYSEADENGTVVYTRTNAEEGAVVKGVNFELNFIPASNISLKSGFTVQSGKFEEEQEFNEKHFFRTPEDYGYLTFDWSLTKSFGFSTTGNYTGKMLVPYFGLEANNPEEGELRESERFYDIGLKIKYRIKVNGAKLELFTGVKNLFNSYQSDFDTGINRDPGYIYGPASPRMLYFGLRLGNFLQ